MPALRSTRCPTCDISTAECVHDESINCQDAVEQAALDEGRHERGSEFHLADIQVAGLEENTSDRERDDAAPYVGKEPNGKQERDGNPRAVGDC